MGRARALRRPTARARARDAITSRSKSKLSDRRRNGSSRARGAVEQIAAVVVGHREARACGSRGDSSTALATYLVAAACRPRAPCRKRCAIPAERRDPRSRSSGEPVRAAPRGCTDRRRARRPRGRRRAAQRPFEPVLHRGSVAAVALAIDRARAARVKRRHLASLGGRVVRAAVVDHDDRCEARARPASRRHAPATPSTWRPALYAGTTTTGSWLGPFFDGRSPADRDERARSASRSRRTMGGQHLGQARRGAASREVAAPCRCRGCARPSRRSRGRRAPRPRLAAKRRRGRVGHARGESSRRALRRARRMLTSLCGLPRLRICPPARPSVARGRARRRVHDAPRSMNERRWRPPSTSSKVLAARAARS